MDYTEIKLQAMLDKLKKNTEEKDGPGAFEHSMRRGQLLMSKKEHELTDEERAFLSSPVPAKQH